MRRRLTIFAAVALAVLTAGCLEEIGGEGTPDTAPQDNSGVENASQEQGEDTDDKPQAGEGAGTNGGDNATPLIDDGRYVPPLGDGDDEPSSTASEDTRSTTDNDEQEEEESPKDTEDGSSGSGGDSEGTHDDEGEEDGSSGEEGGNEDPEDNPDEDESSEDEGDDEGDEEDPDTGEGDEDTTDDDGLVGDIIQSIDMDGEASTPGPDGENYDEEIGTMVLVGTNLRS